MMLLSLIINNGRLILAAVALAGLLYVLNDAKNAACTIEKDSAVRAEAEKIAAQCDQEKKTTQEAYNALQKNTDSLNSRIAALKLRKPARCVPLQPSKPAAQYDAPAAGEKPVGRDAGIDRGNLIDYAGKAEQYRLQLLSCQEFVETITSGRKK